MMNRDQMVIEVISPVYRNNDLIGRIITKALADGGFQNVENYTQQGDPVPPKPLTTVLDAVRSISPDAFFSKINIWTAAPAATIVEFDEVLPEVETEPDEELAEE